MATKLKLTLVKSGIKQEWLAQQTGLKSNTVSRIVNGQMPTLQNAQKIAYALGMTVDELWPYKPVENKKDPYSSE